MLFKNKGAQRHLNKLPLIVQAFLFNLNWKVVLWVMQSAIYISILVYVFYHLTVSING